MNNNTETSKDMFKRECELQEHLPIEERIPVLMDKLKTSKLKTYDKIFELEQNHLVDEKSVKIICDYLKTTGELDYREEETDRNLLHIACSQGWLTLAKCLIEHYGFDAKEINVKSNNWNAFFYCVSKSGNAANKAETFTYLMEKDPFDCFSQLDSDGRSVFWYATFNNEEIGKDIFKRECKLQEHLPIEERIPVLMDKLKTSTLNTYGKILELEQNNLVDEKSVKIISDYLKTTGELVYKEEETGRNLLQIACMEGWLILAKCLIEQHGFDAKEINEKDNNWNAFFYCVGKSGNAANKAETFTYLMEKDPFDCFSQLDSKGRSVFWYATNSGEIGKNIFKRECKLQEHLPIEERIPVLMDKLKTSTLNTYSKILKFEQNNLVEDKSVKIICDYLTTIGELNYIDEQKGWNLLHIACMEGWLSLAKCLIEHYGFDAKEINEKENNWNAFFYCVCKSENVTNKVKIFTYLMEKDPFDCFGQLDLEGRSVFWHASCNNSEIRMEIEKRK